MLGQPYGDSVKHPGQLVLNGAEMILANLRVEIPEPGGGARSRLMGAQDR
jgi:hypothetical protein